MMRTIRAAGPNGVSAVPSSTTPADPTTKSHGMGIGSHRNRTNPRTTARPTMSLTRAKPIPSRIRSAVKKTGRVVGSRKARHRGRGPRALSATGNIAISSRAQMGHGGHSRLELTDGRVKLGADAVQSIPTSRSAFIAACVDEQPGSVDMGNRIVDQVHDRVDVLVEWSFGLAVSTRVLVIRTSKVR